MAGRLSLQGTPLGPGDIPRNRALPLSLPVSKFPSLFLSPSFSHATRSEMRHLLILRHPYVPRNINRYTEFTTHVGLLRCLISYHRTKPQPLDLALDAWKPFFIDTFSILLPICVTYRSQGNQRIFLDLGGGCGDAFQGSAKLPTNRQLVETWTRSDHLETGSRLTLLELSSLPQQTFWVSSSSKHTHSRPGYFSSVFSALCQSGRVTELSHSASSRTSDGTQVVV